jgi:hypothetical protein
MIVIRIALWLIIIGILASPAIAWYGLEDKPLVATKAELSIRDIKSAQDFIKQYDPRNLPDGKITEITATPQQINAGLTGALSGAPMLKARVAPSRYGLLAGITGEIPVPDNPFGRYVNIRMLVESSEEGVRIGRMSIGEIEVPSAVVRPAFILVMDQLAGPGRGKAFLDTIRSIRVSGDRIKIVYNPKDGLLDELKSAAKKTVVAGDPKLTRIYWERIHEVYEKLPKSGRVSFTRYFQPMFALAAERSRNGDPIEENKAAIFALGMFFGDIRLERFVGEVRGGKYKGLPPGTGHVRLEGRQDWVQHFLLSAGLTASGGRGIAVFIGEAKEVQDSGKASGFSFTDIGADRAGVRFAEVALSSASAARRIQGVISKATREEDFFPKVSDLPEGLSAAEFKSRYGDRNSTAYKQLVAEIDRRIGGIPIYR